MSETTPSKLQKILAAGQLAVTSEVGPPRSADGEVIDHKAKLIKDYVDAINVTDNQTSVCRMCSLACCIRIKLMGLEPILQMATRDRNRIALQSDILGAASFGINNHPLPDRRPPAIRRPRHLRQRLRPGLDAAGHGGEDDAGRRQAPGGL